MLIEEIERNEPLEKAKTLYQFLKLEYVKIKMQIGTSRDYTLPLVKMASSANGKMTSHPKRDEILIQTVEDSIKELARIIKRSEDAPPHIVAKRLVTFRNKVYGLVRKNMVPRSNRGYLNWSKKFNEKSGKLWAGHFLNAALKEYGLTYDYLNGVIALSRNIGATRTIRN